MIHFFTWIPCSKSEEWLLWLNPVIPWPHDYVKTIKPTAHASLWRLVELAGWGEVRKCPEVRRLTKLKGAIDG